MSPHPNNAAYKKAIKLGKWFAGFVMLCAITVVVAYFLLPVDKILEQRLKTWLLAQGVEAEFTVSTLTARRLALEDATIAGANAPKLESLHATYSLDSLRSKRVGKLDISGLNVTISQMEDGAFTITGLPLPPPKQNTGSGFTLPVLPFDILTANNVLLTFKNAKGTAATLTANLELHSDYTGELHISEASIPLGNEEIVLTNLRLKREAPNAPFAFTLENIAHITSQKAYFTPLTATGELTLARDNRELDSNIIINDLRKLWTLNVNGKAQLDAGTWNINFEQPEMQFESGIIQPDMLFPMLRGVVTQASGSVSLKGSAGKTADAPIHSEGQITFSDMAATIKDIPVNGVNGTVALSSLYPPATKGKQTINIGEIVLGLPLKSGQMTFTLGQDGKTTFLPSAWEWAGGTLHTNGATLNLYAPALPDITLSAKGLALENLLSGLLQKGVTATGALSGTIPVTFTKEREAMIRDGKLKTDAGGIVRYLPTEDSPLQKGGSFQTDILLSAMENFHYDSISMTINSKTAQELDVLLQVKGRNPELYNGQTIELNINLTGNLVDIVQSGMNVYTLPERLQEQLMQ